MALFTSASASEHNITLPDFISSEWNSSQQIGNTKFSRFGIHIYNASLWSLKKNVKGDTPGNSNNVHATALIIKYARNISSEQLLSSTYKQWKYLGFADQLPLESWLRELEMLWPDVRSGDYLIFVSSQDGTNTFYSKKEMLGSIDDNKFAPAFLDIWLSPEAKYQKHRKELLGEI